MSLFQNSLVRVRGTNRGVPAHHAIGLPTVPRRRAPLPPRVGGRRRGGALPTMSRMIQRRLFRGVGQLATSDLASAAAATPGAVPTTQALQQVASQSTGPMILMAGGSLALLVGVVGAILSDTYREEFAITAGAGLLADVVGGAWMGSNIASAAVSGAASQVAQAAAVPAPASVAST
jgi:hypothetical protein